MKKNSKGNILHQHGLRNAQFLLLLCHIAHVHEHVLEEQSIHLVVHVVRVRVRPDDQRAVLGRGRAGPEPVRVPRGDLVRARLRRVLGRVDRVDGAVRRGGADFAAHHVEGFELLEVQVQRRGLEYQREGDCVSVVFVLTREQHL